jgi:hypothetical protein
MIFAVLAALSFAVAILMHCFGWSSGKVDVELFALLGLLGVALHLAGFGGYVAGRWNGRNGTGTRAG